MAFVIISYQSTKIPDIFESIQVDTLVFLTSLAALSKTKTSNQIIGSQEKIK